MREESKAKDRKKVQVVESQAKESRAVRAKDWKKVQTKEREDKAKGDSDKQKSQGRHKHSSFGDNILKVLKKLKEISKSFAEVFGSLKELKPYFYSLFKFMRGI